jgi:pilus assembly protein Flp/PilA
VKKKLHAFLRDEEALSIVEYAVAGGLIAAALVLAFETLGVSVGAVMSLIDGYL